MTDIASEFQRLQRAIAAEASNHRKSAAAINVMMTAAEEAFRDEMASIAEAEQALAERRAKAMEARAAADLECRAALVQLAGSPATVAKERAA